MKSKSLAILLLLLVVACVISACKQNTTVADVPVNMDSTISTAPSQTTDVTVSTTVTEHKLAEETEPAEVIVLESTPNSVTLEVESEDGTKIQVQIGDTDEDVFPNEQGNIGQQSAQIQPTPTETNSTETQPTETQPTETQPTETQPTETQPTETQPTETQPTETQPTETQPTETQPTETQPAEAQPIIPQPSEPSTFPAGSGTVGPNRATTFAEYEAMSAMDQLLFYYKFADANDFYAWYNAAKAEHEANNGGIIIG